MKIDLAQILAGRGVSVVPTAYAVHCPLHGKAYLTTLEYSRQMLDRNARWTCPHCHKVSIFDDNNYEDWQCADSGEEEHEPVEEVCVEYNDADQNENGPIDTGEGPA